MVVEAVRGLGEKLVGGLVTPDTYIESGERYLSRDVPILSDDELAEVILLTKRVAEFLGYAVDIEWAYEQDELYLLQARPITTV